MQFTPTLRRVALATILFLMLLVVAVLLIGWLTGSMDGQQSALNNAALPYYRDISLRPRWDRWSSWQSTARFSLTDHHGRSIDQSVLERRPTVIGFFYAGCVSICPVSLEVLRELDNTLAKNPSVARPQFMLLTVTPEFDTPQVLSSYARRLHLPDDWELATGKPAEVYRLGASLLSDIRTPGVGGEPPHAQRAFLLDTKRRIRGVYDASSMMEMRRMANDYQRLVSGEDTGSL